MENKINVFKNNKGDYDYESKVVFSNEAVRNDMVVRKYVYFQCSLRA